MKRFTETTKWDDPWFIDLEPSAKLLWLYLLDKCDNAGVVDISVKLAGMLLNGENCVEAGIKTLCAAGRLEEIEGGKYYIPGFVIFQYGELKPGSNLHKNVIALLNKHGLIERFFNPSDTLNEGFMKGPGKGKGKGKDISNGTSKGDSKGGNEDDNQEGEKPKKKPDKKELAKVPSFGEFKAYIDEKKSQGYSCSKDPFLIYEGYIENDWRDANNKPIVRWKQKLCQVWLDKASTGGASGDPVPDSVAEKLSQAEWDECSEQEKRELVAMANNGWQA